MLFIEFEESYYRSVLFFSKECRLYSIRIDSNGEPGTINFTLLSNGLTAAAAVHGDITD